jgi:tRNA(Ile)-lysidine synthase
VTNQWIEKIERGIGRWLDQRTSRVWVVAVSGGGDSVGLLRVLCQLARPLGLDLSVAHLDHGVRGEAARADALFVAALADSLGLPLDLGEWQPARTGHFESDARRARYDWLMQIARARGAGAIAVGHTRDDQAETILHRILRGTGPRGLAGIPARRPLCADPRLTLVRPLLRVSRREIREFLAAIDQPFREDETNAALSRTRSRIRHDLLPKLAAEYNPAVSEALVRLGELSASLERAIGRDARAAANMSAGRWHRLAAMIESPEIQPCVIGARVEVSSEGLFVLLRRLPKTQASVSTLRSQLEISLALPGRTEIPWAGCIIHAETGESRGESPSEVVDFDQVSGRVFVRGPLAGDRFDPLGMGGKTMPLADFFRGRRVPLRRRGQTPLVCDQAGIIWVVGHRIAERVKATKQTEHVLCLSVSSQSAVPTSVQ